MISKEEFENAYRKFPPKGHEAFFIRYFSMYNLSGNKLAAILTSLFLILPFLSEVLLKTSGFTYVMNIILRYSYILILAILGSFWFVTWYKKSQRYKKIRKYLNISNKEYKEIIDTYYIKYPTIENFIK